MKKRIFAIIGSTRTHSSNLKLIEEFAKLSTSVFDIEIYNRIAEIPHFNPDLDTEHPPERVTEFRQKIKDADAVIICTPEYVFSLPGSLKNAMEWCVSTLVFSQKPLGLITAAASGIKAQEDLKLLLKTLEAEFNEDSTLLISGIKAKFTEQGNLKDSETKHKLEDFKFALEKLLQAKLPQTQAN